MGAMEEFMHLLRKAATMRNGTHDMILHPSSGSTNIVRLIQGGGYRESSHTDVNSCKKWMENGCSKEMANRLTAEVAS